MPPLNPRKFLVLTDGERAILRKASQIAEKMRVHVEDPNDDTATVSLGSLERVARDLAEGLEVEIP